MEIAGELNVIGVLAKTDTSSLALLVRARVRWERCARKVRELGEVLEDKTEGGRLYRNPWAIAEEKAWQQYKVMCTEHGLTPASRSKVAHVAPSRPAPKDSSADPQHDVSAKYFGA